jgi:hypothetical protein
MGLMHVTETLEKQNETAPSEATAPGKPSSRKSILALAVFALGINTAAAVQTLAPSNFTLPDVNRLAELLPQLKVFDPTPDPAVAALTDIQSAQQQHVATLQENNALLQQSRALLQQDSIALASLRQSVSDERADVKKISAQITDGHADVKKMSAQISVLTAKVDALKSVLTQEVTSSIPARHARSRLSRTNKGTAAEPKLTGPVSIGGAPLSYPATRPTPPS